MSRFLFGNSIGDEFQRIGSARVFRERVIFQIDQTGNRIKGNIFEDRSKSFGGRVDLRFGRFRESNHLGVASAFEVEYTFIAPAMLIVPDQATGGIGGQSRLAGTA